MFTSLTTLMKIPLVTTDGEEHGVHTCGFWPALLLQRFASLPGTSRVDQVSLQFTRQDEL